MTKTFLRVAAVGDIHCTRASQGMLQTLYSTVGENADILLLCGDLTEHGLPEEAHMLAKELALTVKIPVLAVLGNHDYESAKQDEIKSILNDSGVRVLDGEAYEMNGVGFSGIKGFIGGFGRWALSAYGEESLKKIVHEAVEEALKLESALARANTEQHVVFMHYSPIQKTVEGEPPEIYPYLGSSRLEEPMTRYPVAAVFHGHAHKGTLEGATSSGTPVFNVALPLLRAQLPGSPAYRVVNIPIHVASSESEIPPTPINPEIPPTPINPVTVQLPPGMNLDATIDPNAQAAARVTLSGHE